jgi:hypothetical protein
VVVIDVDASRERFEVVAPFLDERSRRLIAALEANAAGYGGIAAVALASGMAQRHCRVRRRDGGHQHQTRRVPWQLELHHLTRYPSSVTTRLFSDGPYDPN